MYEKPKTITLSGEEIPIKCDFVVLEKIQEKYGSVVAFEKLIYTFVPKLDGDGNLVETDGMIVGNVVTPADLKPLFDALLWMVEEGCEIMKELGGTVPEFTPEKLKRMIDIPPYQLSDILHEEYTRCFERKN